MVSIENISIVLKPPPQYGGLVPLSYKPLALHPVRNVPEGYTQTTHLGEVIAEWWVSALLPDIVDIDTASGRGVQSNEIQYAH